MKSSAFRFKPVRRNSSSILGKQDELLGLYWAYHAVREYPESRYAFDFFKRTGGMTFSTKRREEEEILFDISIDCDIQYPISRLAEILTILRQYPGFDEERFLSEAVDDDGAFLYVKDSKVEFYSVSFIERMYKVVLDAINKFNTGYNSLFLPISYRIFAKKYLVRFLKYLIVLQKQQQ